MLGIKQKMLYITMRCMGPRLKKVGITIFTNNFSTMIPRKVMGPPPKPTTFPESGRNSYTDICMLYKRLKSLLMG